jgi:hypothetical protein
MLAEDRFGCSLVLGRERRQLPDASSTTPGSGALVVRSRGSATDLGRARALRLPCTVAVELGCLREREPRELRRPGVTGKVARLPATGVARC